MINRQKSKETIIPKVNQAGGMWLLPAGRERHAQEGIQGRDFWMLGAFDTSTQVITQIFTWSRFIKLYIYVSCNDCNTSCRRANEYSWQYYLPLITLPRNRLKISQCPVLSVR